MSNILAGRIVLLFFPFFHNFYAFEMADNLAVVAFTGAFNATRKRKERRGGNEMPQTTTPKS